ncbi:MAG TPA: response regulator transcription factor [Anaerolineae bacterium]|nr:response regulator transcription factor [Anaerolineae bacterium]
MTSSQHILIVDDEPNVGDVLGIYLRRENYQVSIARDGQTALALIEQTPPDLIVLDLMLPKIDGLSIVRRVRGDEGHAGLFPEIPIVILTAKGEESDRISGLDLGADDYVIKPFSPRELVSRVKAVLRRSKGASVAPERPLSFGPLSIDPKSREVSLNDRECSLTAKEFDLLYFMARHTRQVFTRDQLLEHVWDLSEYIDPSTVTVHIRRLREKVESDPGKPEWIHTVWGIGYKFDPEEAE